MAQPVITDGLISYYPLNNDAKDYSGNGYDGKWQGNEKYKYNSAKFDGKSLISFGIGKEKGISKGEFSFSCYFYSEDKKGVILSIGARTGRNVFLLHPTMAEHYLTKKSEPYCDESCINKWVHIALNQSKGISTIYINGIKKVEFKSEVSFSSSQSVLIGADRDDNGNPQTGLKGYINNVYFFNRTLSEDEIKKLRDSYTNENINNIKITYIETSPNINLKTSGTFYSDMIYTDYEKEINKNNTIKLENSKYKFADVFITGTNLKIDNIDYGDGLKYFLGKSVGETINISGDIKENIIVYHNGHWDNKN